MSFALAHRKNAVRARLDEVFGTNSGYGYFDVKLTRQKKHEPRTILISWVVYPLEAEVIDVLGDLFGDDVKFKRRQMWTCGIFHADEMDAWKAHEGSDHLEYEEGYDGWISDEKILSEGTEVELIANGETFESKCRPGNYLRCPTCGGGASIRGQKSFTFSPCPDCVRLGIDRSPFLPGILDLDVPEQREFFEYRLAEKRAKDAAAAAREQAKRDQAMKVPTTLTKPVWVALPTRDAGILNGFPVAEKVGCDVLTHVNDPERRVGCGNDAKWFDPNTGLRACAKHKSIKS